MSDFGEQFEKALIDALRRYSKDARKTGVPMISHLMAVCGLVIEGGGTEEEAIAALLHDAGEDHGGEAVLRQIEAEYGPQVSSIVRGCSDSLPSNKRSRADWTRRKKQFLKDLEKQPESVLKIDVADKLHNARMCYRDARANGVEFFQQTLRRTAEETVAYFKVAHRIFERVYPCSQTDELGHTVMLLEAYCNPRQLRVHVADLSDGTSVSSKSV